MPYIIKYRFVIGVLIGSICGWLYWNFVGCENGTCLIKSNPYMMMVYGGVMGLLLFEMIVAKNKSKKG